MGKNICIKPCVNIKYPWRLFVGDNVWIGENVWIDNLADVNIGNNVCISQGTMLLTGNHNYKSRCFDLMIGGINLEDGSWVGAKSVVCPAVTMAKGSVLSVGSVLTKNTEENGIYHGVPASLVRYRK